MVTKIFSCFLSSHKVLGQSDCVVQALLQHLIHPSKDDNSDVQAAI